MKFIPIDKQSKKSQKKYYADSRRTWGECNPITRVIPNGKAYNRAKSKENCRKEVNY